MTAVAWLRMERRSLSAFSTALRRARLSALLWMVFAFGCVPVPVSTVGLHARTELPVLAESNAAPDQGGFSAPAFDASGALVVAFESASQRVMIFRAKDLTLLSSRTLSRWPQRMRFSPVGGLIVIENYEGWLEGLLRGSAQPEQPAIDSPDAIRDGVQTVAVWDYARDRLSPELRCTEEQTTPPQRGWLWARDTAIVPGLRRSSILDARSSADETEVWLLCADGVRQRWRTTDWMPLESIPAPAWWSDTHVRSDAKAVASANDRLVMLVSSRQAPAVVWDWQSGSITPLRGECLATQLPAHGVSADGARIVMPCLRTLGTELRVWDLDTATPRTPSRASVSAGNSLRTDGVALSPDGHRLAAVAMEQAEVLLVTPLPGLVGAVTRSDLLIWNLSESVAPLTIGVDELVPGHLVDRAVGVTIARDGGSILLAGRRLALMQLQ